MHTSRSINAHIKTYKSTHKFAGSYSSFYVTFTWTAEVHKQFIFP